MLYLPRRKWKEYETVIFFKIRSVFKKYRDGCCIYQDGNEKSTKRSFSLRYVQCLKSIEMDAVFTTREMSKELNVPFLQNLCKKQY